MLKDKVILLTGGTGSFGQEFARQALAYEPKAVRIFSRGEYMQWRMQNEFDDSRLRFLIGDIRDKERVRRAMEGVDIVIHAAALKQVPTAEYNPIEAVKTNIGGTINVIDAALDSNVKSVMAISTDKAVQPLNLYGKTKAVMESLITQANVYNKGRFSCVRYGNVFGSRGSLAEMIDEQKEQGSIKLTHPEMTRFWLSKADGVRFVLKCLDRMLGGEIFIPKVSSRRVLDVITELAPGVPINVTGIRNGEKMHEVLISEDEARRTLDCGDYYLICPEYPFWTEDKFYGEPLSDGFSYRSNTSSSELNKIATESHA